MSKLLEFAMSKDADYGSLSREQLESCLKEIRTQHRNHVMLEEIVKENIALKDSQALWEERATFWQEEANRKHSTIECKLYETNAALCQKVKELELDNALKEKRIYALEHQNEEDLF